MKDLKNKRFDTQTIHAGADFEKPFGALNVPIFQNATFRFENCEAGRKLFAGESKGYAYSRTANPTTSYLEERVALLEKAEAAVAFGSGMGAISSVLWSILKSGDHIVADTTLYSCTYTLFVNGFTRFGIDVTFVDMSNLEELKGALRDNTTVVYVESPANPNMKVVDLKGVADIAHGHNKDIQVICDNTFASPYLQLPLELGHDIVVHSVTKYLNGHGDVIAGIACGTAETMQLVRGNGLKDLTGAVLGMQEAFLVLRGLKTLAIRMERHCDNAEKVAEYLNNHPKVERVQYPGLPTHPGHDIAKKQMKRFGGMLSFDVKGGREAGAKLLDHMEMCVLAVSLGDAETLVEHPASMTHGSYTAEELKESGITEGLVRVSVGLEAAEDIIADFEQAFQYV